MARHLQTSRDFAPIRHMDGDRRSCAAEPRLKIARPSLTLRLNWDAVKFLGADALTCVEVFLAPKAELFIAPAIVVDIVEAVNCLAGANSRQEVQIAALLRSTSMSQLLLDLVVLLGSELLLMCHR